MRPWSRHKRLPRLKTSILPEVPSVLFGDSERIRQILVNLVSNAVTHTSKGQTSIRLRALEKTAESGRFLYEVEDTGIGIKKQEQNKLFQPFARINGSQIRERTGLGLCKHITEKMGATFGFESEYGKGSTFWFEVPLGISPVSVRQVPLQRRRIRDVPQFREWAHRAKGSCLAIGAERLAYTCKELQELGDQGASRGFAEELLGVAKDEVDLTLAELMHLGPSVSLLSPPRTSFTPDRASFTPDRASYSPERISIKPSYSPRIRSTDQA